MKSSNSRGRSRQLRGRQFDFQQLEAKRMLASVFLDPADNRLYIAGNAKDNVASASIVGDDLIARVDTVSKTIPVSSISDIVFIGYRGDDAFTNNTSIDSSMFGHGGNDTLVGGSGNDNLVGGPGDDVVSGNAGDDRVVGASGNDTLNGGDGDDSMFGSSGQNIIRGDDGNDLIFGGEEADELFGGAGIDRLFALAGDDILHSGPGGEAGGSFDQGDLMMGHAGNDTFIGGGGMDIFYGGNGDDVMTGGNGENRMHGQNGDDNLTGGPNFDLLNGNNGNDTIAGLTGDNRIDLGPGDRDVAVFDARFAVGLVETSNRGANVEMETSSTTNRVLKAEWLEFTDRRIRSWQADLSATDEIHVNKLNEFRQSQGEEILSTPNDLAEFALDWSKEMARSGFRHSSSSLRQQLFNGGRFTVGENIISKTNVENQTAEEIAIEFQDRWEASSSHRTNMLKSKFTEVGVGIVLINGTWWGTQVFAG